METGVDSYLHKKFKKQLSIEPRPSRHEREIKSVSAIVESREEKTSFNHGECNNVADNQRRTDNNESVPNHSTNSISSLSSSSLTKSSISLEECTANIQSRCISFVDPKCRDDEDYRKRNFDTTEPKSSQTTTPSSILDNLYSKNVKGEDPAKDYEAAPEKNDKSSSGKYVCTYCNLVCSKPSVLQKHIRAHTNERPYPCNSCGFSFKTRSNLYKHCRSRTHANRVMGNKIHDINSEDMAIEPRSPPNNETIEVLDLKNKPYKPRFHTFNAITKENLDDKPEKVLLSDHINDIISKNNSIVNCTDSYVLKKRSSEVEEAVYTTDEPLNLTSKNRKRCMSEVVEPVVQKSLIKELLLKNLNSDMQCPHCKMIFQTFTELELHKLRSCKGFVKAGAKYNRSSSVNVASILTQNKNAFDNIPHLQNVFPLKSPGPFLGKTRLVESDKSKSFSFDDNLPAVLTSSDRFLLSPLTLPNERERKTPVKLFGGEVKIAHTTGETKSFKIDNKECDKFDGGGYSEKMSESRVVKCSLQSGGTILTNKANYTKQDSIVGSQDIIRVYDSTPLSPSIDISNFTKHPGGSFVKNDMVQHPPDITTSPYKYTNIMDFSQKAVKLLTPNLKQPNLGVPGVPVPSKFTFPPLVEENQLENPQIQNLSSPKTFQPKVIPPVQPNLLNPMKLLVNGKVVRYVPGIPGPVVNEEPMDIAYTRPRPSKPPVKIETLEIKTDLPPLKSPKPIEKSPIKQTDKPAALTESKKFARPNSLALKPTTVSLKQHHGLTPTMFNQILISPDTPRVAKKYVQQFLHGNYFSYLGLKCSTKPVYCTLNKTQPFYVPHFKKLSMYSEWRQLDTKTEKFFVSGYDSRQRHDRYTMAGRTSADLVVHSSYKFVVSESPSIGEKNEENQKLNTIPGGYECNEDYTYIRGRGRGRYVCDQCGIRCKKPSMLKKHIRTHSNDRPFTCNHCNFSFKTKGNLTKHMKSKAHTKNYVASGSGSSTQQSGTQSSDSDSDESSMDSSDESTRREEHEAAYGLLSLSQKSSQNIRRDSSSPPSDSPSIAIMNTEEVAHISKSSYAKNKILEGPLNFATPKTPTMSNSDEEVQNVTQFLGRTSINRPLTYPYTSKLLVEDDATNQTCLEEDGSETKSIRQFQVIQKYVPTQEAVKLVESDNSVAARDRTKVFVQTNEMTSRGNVLNVNNVQTPVLKVNDVVMSEGQDLRKRKLSVLENDNEKVVKQYKGDEVMDLSVEKTAELRFNGSPHPDAGVRSKEMYSPKQPPSEDVDYGQPPLKNNGNFVLLSALPNDVNINYVIQEQQPVICESPKSYQSVEYDYSAMDTLADIATKQVKLEKNTLAKSVASEYLKIATKNEFASGEMTRDNSYGPGTEVNDLIVKPEGSKNCHVCAKSFSKASQLRLHMNIHYLERPFRCHSCSVSFRTKGHLQKHERSASHHNKLSSSPALSSSEPRPFKCVDCNIAFRIHGHLAKHLRSKMHIMKLECLAKIPFGLYAELERSNSLLTEINTADGDQCLESLKTLAKKVFINDPNKLNQLGTAEHLDADS